MPTTQCEPGPSARSDASICAGVIGVCALPVRASMSAMSSVPVGACAVGEPLKKSFMFAEVLPQFVAYPFDGSLGS